MAEQETTTLTSAERQPERVPPVLDEAHIGDIRGALGTISTGISSSSTHSRLVP